LYRFREGSLLGCGNPLLDISAVVEDSFLAKYDMLPNNAILAEEKHMPIYGELIEKHNADFIAGGSVQNSLRVAQWILQKPNVAVFFGCVGEDHYADKLREKATHDGVNVQYQVVQGTPTGTVSATMSRDMRMRYL
jgi:adenosine kinase